MEFPNDLLHELDQMRFVISETQKEVVAEQRPVVIITSNNEKELPDAFLRRCVFHFLDFPEPDFMHDIVQVHHPNLERRLVDSALQAFFALRETARLRKRPSTSELIDWLAALAASGIEDVRLEVGMPFLGILIKKEQDLELIKERLLRGPGLRN